MLRLSELVKILLLLSLPAVAWQGATVEAGAAQLMEERRAMAGTAPRERRRSYRARRAVLRLKGGRPDDVEMLYWKSLKETSHWNRAAGVLEHQVTVDDESVQELAVKLGQLAGNQSGLSLKERSQLNDQDLFNLAKRLHINKNEHRAAETLYRMCIRENPYHVGALCNYGVLLEEFKQDAKSSESLFRFAHEISPLSAPVKHSLAQSLQIQGRVEEAGRMYEEALQADEDFLPTLKQYSAFLVLTGGNFSRAEELFLLALESDPQDLKTFFQFIFLASMRGESVGPKARKILNEKGEEGRPALKLLDTFEKTNGQNMFNMMDFLQNSSTHKKDSGMSWNMGNQLKMVERVMMNGGEEEEAE